MPMIRKIHIAPSALRYSFLASMLLVKLGYYTYASISGGFLECIPYLHDGFIGHPIPFKGRPGTAPHFW